LCAALYKGKPQKLTQTFSCNDTLETYLVNRNELDSNAYRDTQGVLAVKQVLRHMQIIEDEAYAVKYDLINPT
jgi:hypothetical protein